MAYEVEQVTTRSQLDAVAAHLIDHSDSSRLLFFPIQNEDRRRSLDEMRERLWHEHTSSPEGASNWIFVRHPSPSAAELERQKSDGSDFTVVGTCQWRFYQASPFPQSDGGGGPTTFDAPWWPEGSGARDFTSQFIGNAMTPRMKWMNRPHAGMSWIAVHPDHRRRRIAQALMNWGIERLDQLGLESYIESTAMGAPMYESCGYGRVTRVTFRLTPRPGANVDEQWRELEREFVPFTYTSMWRPKGGVWKDGVLQDTWGPRLKDAAAGKFGDDHNKIEIETDVVKV